MKQLVIEFPERPYLQHGPCILLRLTYVAADAADAVAFARQASCENNAVCTQPHFIVISDDTASQLWVGMGGPKPS